MNDVRAADALANERTYLAYVRTALAFIAFGFAQAAHISIPPRLAPSYLARCGAAIASSRSGVPATRSRCGYCSPP
ncbi:MAG: DUF202 domain-containing protein [Candidatus Baltobacteraceae bacterium]